jgi:putative ABC transport system permease protein
VSAATLAWAYLRERPLATLLNVILLGLGVGTIIALILTLTQAEERMERDGANVDLVIGAKGSPLQLVLSALYQIDVPTGNIRLREAAAIIAAPQVKRAYPLALGDSYKTFRIAGTNPDYAELYGATLATGRMWNKPLEAVIGADVARTGALTLNQNFAGAHGLSDGGGAHAEHPYTVVGTLTPTGTLVDRLILTSVESVWQVHDHDAKENKADSRDHGDDHSNDHRDDHNGKHADEHKNDSKEITAYLIQYATPLAAASFPKMVNATSSMQAASPASETARLFSFIGLGVTALKGFAAVMMLCAGLGIFIGLMNALDERRADLALLRVLGARPATVFLTVVLQGFALGIAGVILGLILGHAGAEWMGAAVEKAHRVKLTGWVLAKEEIWVIGSALLLAMLAALFPAWRAYREAVPQTLSRG